MIFTNHFRWLSYQDFQSDGEGFLLPIKRRVLQQFVEIVLHESDLTLPKVIGPTGHIGRWVDIEEVVR